MPVFAFVRAVLSSRFGSCLQPVFFKRLWTALDVGPFFFICLVFGRHLRYQIFMLQSVFYGSGQDFIDFFSPSKADFHFGRMYIDIDQAAVYRNLQHGKRILVLH